VWRTDRQTATQPSFDGKDRAIQSVARVKSILYPKDSTRLIVSAQDVFNKRPTTMRQSNVNKLCAWRHNMPPPLQVDNIFAFIRQVAAPVPACWLFKTSATSWPLTFWPLKWCPSHVCRGSYLCANFSLPGPLCSPVRPDVRDRQTDRQTSDVRQNHCLNINQSKWGSCLRALGHRRARLEKTELQFLNYHAEPLGRRSLSSDIHQKVKFSTTVN